jgi:hypothetical protein
MVALREPSQVGDAVKSTKARINFFNHRGHGGSRGRARLAGCDPDLIGDDGHHEKKVEAERPYDQEFGAFEMAAVDVVFFCFDQLLGFEGGEDPGLIGGGG